MDSVYNLVAAQMIKQKILIVISILLIALIVSFSLPKKLFENLSNPNIIAIQYEENQAEHTKSLQISVPPTTEEEILQHLSSSSLRRTFMYELPTTSSGTYLHIIVQDDYQRLDVHFFDDCSYVISNKTPFIYQFTEYDRDKLQKILLQSTHPYMEVC